MRVWIINPFDELPSEPGRPGRYSTLASLLDEHGHEVVWWTAAFSHRYKQPRKPVSSGNGHPATIRQVSVPHYRRNVGFARIWSHARFGRNLERDARAAVASGELPVPDRLIASFPPLEAGEAALRLGQEWGVPVSLDVQDAWPESFARFIPGGTTVQGLVLAPWRRRAHRVFSEVERVAGVGRAFLEYAESLGTTGPTHLTYLGAHFDEEPGVAREGRSPESPLRLLYLGNVGRSQDLSTVVEGVGLLVSAGFRVTLDVAGVGEKWESLRTEVEKRGLQGVVTLHGFLDGAELELLVSRAHVGVNPIRADSLIACPNKVADYLAAGLPVLNTLPGELAEMLSQFDCGGQYVIGDAGSLVSRLREWIETPGQIERFSRNARRLGEAHFAREATYPALGRFLVGADAPTP